MSSRLSGASFALVLAIAVTAFRQLRLSLPSLESALAASFVAASLVKGVALSLVYKVEILAAVRRRPRRLPTNRNHTLPTRFPVPLIGKRRPTDCVRRLHVQTSGDSLRFEQFIVRMGVVGPLDSPV